MRNVMYALTMTGALLVSAPGWASSLTSNASPSSSGKASVLVDGLSRASECTDVPTGRDCHIHNGQAFLMNERPPVSQPHARQEYERMDRAYSGPTGRR